MKSQLQSNQEPPKVIFLDAMGTLFGLKKSVGEIYQAIAIKYGVKISPSFIDRAFIASFKTAPPLAFSSSYSEEKMYLAEFNWWQKIVRDTFEKLDTITEFTDFSAFFAEVYAYFATERPWYVYPDVIPSLQRWEQKGIELGVISNFDRRLYQVLELLKIKQFFSSITISSEAGFAKPNPKIFHIALQKHHCISQQAWHIGDSLIEDYQGAIAVEIKSFWLNRDQQSINYGNQLPNLNTLG
ncbi:MAG: HAD-IA family hydrolase [Pleurocapsa sp.]